MAKSLNGVKIEDGPEELLLLLNYVVDTLQSIGKRGLTEYQENAFYEQPYEVEKRTYEKTITVTEWINK